MDLDLIRIVDLNLIQSNIPTSTRSLSERFHLFVCVQDISKSYERIQTKLGGDVGCVTRKNCFNFGEDPNPHPDPIIFSVILHH